MEKGVLKNFAKFAGNTCAELGCNFIKNALAQVFLVNFEKILRTPSLQNTSGRLPLKTLKNFYEYYSS